MPRKENGEINLDKTLVGDDLIEFVNNELFPYLKSFQNEESKGIEAKIGEVFKEIRNKITSGYNLRDIIEQIDCLKFQTSEQKHELTFLYERSLNKMGNAGRNGGEYYTPPANLRAVVHGGDVTTAFIS